MKQYDIEYRKLESGAIRLKQDSCGSDDTIDLHPMQLRAIAEHFGLVAPVPPADELAKRLAEQLCTAFLTLSDEQPHWSPKLEILWERLDVQIDCLPSEVFPHHLWERREEEESTASQQSPCHADGAAGNAPMPENETGAISEQQMGLTI